MTAIRVFLADDHAVLRDSLKAFLSLHADLAVIGEAGDGITAIAEVLRLRPDVLLLDLAMAGLSGIEVTCRLKRDLPTCAIVILSQHQDPDYVLPVLRAGADGYVLKTAGGADVVAAIRAVQRGEAYLHPAIVRLVLEFSVRVDYPQAEPLACLTHREQEVLALIGQGQTNHKIAEALSISTKTVDKHRARLMQKLQVDTRAELIRYALERKIVPQSTAAIVHPTSSVTATA
jgi:two-component system response regulator NreC